MDTEATSKLPLNELLSSFARNVSAKYSTFREAERRTGISHSTLHRWSLDGINRPPSPNTVRKALSYLSGKTEITDIYTSFSGNKEVSDYLKLSFPEVLISSYSNKEFKDSLIEDEYDFYIVKFSVCDSGATEKFLTDNLSSLMLHKKGDEFKRHPLEALILFREIVREKIQRLYSLGVIEKKGDRYYKSGGSSDYSDRLKLYDAMLSLDFYKPHEFHKGNNIRYGNTMSVPKESLKDIVSIVQKHASAMLDEICKYETESGESLPVNCYIGFEKLTFNENSGIIDNKETVQ